MTLAELKTEMIALADDPAITSAQAGTWILSNYYTLLREFDWPFMVANGTYTVTSGTQETAFTAFDTAISDFAKPLRVWIASSSTADKTELLPLRYEDRNEPGISGYYYITPNNLSIGLVPTPTNSTEVVTMDYLKTGASLADGDSPIFISDFHWILVWKALMNYQFQQREQSDEFRAQYEEILSSMLKFYKMTQAGSVPRLTRATRIDSRSGTADPLNRF